MDPLVWAGLLLGLGLLLVMLEFFIPSSGIIGVMAFLSITAGIVMAYYHRGAVIGTAFLLTAACSVPLILILGFKILPHTPVGKLLISSNPEPEEVLSDIATRRHLRDMIGWIGKAETAMLPSGSIRIGDQSLDAVSQGMAIDAGTPVKVVDVQGTRIIVRPCREEELLNQQFPAEPIFDQSGNSEPAAAPTTPTERIQAADELLSQSLEALGIENWDLPSKPTPTTPPSGKSGS